MAGLSSVACAVGESADGCVLFTSRTTGPAPGVIMNLTRSLLLLPLLAALIAGGCKSRETKTLAGDELKAENARLTTQITGLESENQALTQQRDEARSALKRLQEQQGSIEGQLKDILGSGGEIAGVYRTERGGIGLDEDFAFAKGSADLNPEGIK